MLLLFLLLVVPSGSLLVQEIPECWCIPTKNDNPKNYNNIDSIAFDTCGVEMFVSNCNAQGYLDFLRDKERMYIKRGMSFEIEGIAFTIDTNNNSPRLLTIKDIKPEFINLKNQLLNIENKLGRMKFHLLYELYSSQVLEVFFESYVLFDSASYEFNQINSILWIAFEHEIRFVNGIKNHLKNTYSVIIKHNKQIEEIDIKLFTVNPQKIEIIVYNLCGLIMYKRNYERLIDEGDLKINCSEFPNGLYFIKIGDYLDKFLIYK